jgi:hypothetical protein
LCQWPIGRPADWRPGPKRRTLVSMLPESFAIVGAVISSLGGLYYLVETIRGRTQPNRVTWLLWWLFPTVIFVAQRAQGVDEVSWLSFAAGFSPLLVVIASVLNKRAYWKSRPMDYGLMAVAIVGIVAWVVTSDPNLAIVFALVADLLAGVPTFIKAFRQPETESWIAYAISAVGFGLGILAIHDFSFESSAFAIYLFLMNAVLAIFAGRKRSSGEIP